MSDEDEEVFLTEGCNNGHMLHPPSSRSQLRSSLVKDKTHRRPSPGGKSVSFSTMPDHKKVSNVQDCLTYMHMGSELTKIRGPNKRYRRYFSLDTDNCTLRWTPTNKKLHRAKISVDEIREIRVGRATETLRSTESCLEETPEDCTFSIIWGDDLQALDLMAKSADEANIWVSGLMALSSTSSSTSGEASPGIGQSSSHAGSTLRESPLRVAILPRPEFTQPCVIKWLDQMFKEFNCEFIDEEQALKLIRQLNPRLLTSRIKQKMKEVRSQQRGRLSSSEFCEVYKDVSTRPEIYFLMVRYANKDYLTWDDIQLFLENEQGIAAVTKDLCLALIERYEPSQEGRLSNILTVDGFANYLLSEECCVFDNTHRVVCQDMSQQMSHYFVSTSFNTYLLEDQLKGPSSVEGYMRALKRGCRVVELDVWDKEDGDPVIYHGHTLTSRIAVRAVLVAIAEFAFETTPYPLILKLEVHISPEKQIWLANLIKAILGPKLFIPDPDSIFNPCMIPSPESLKSKILILCKRIENDTGDIGEVSEEDESAENNRASKVSRKSSVEKRKMTLVRDLSDITCPFLISHHVRDLHEAIQNSDMGGVVSLNESQTLKMAQAYPEDFACMTKTCLTRVYPNSVRVDSSNLNPQEFWNFGVQMVALNYQTPGLMMDLQDGKFNANGACGYVLKPTIMTDEQANFTPRDKLALSIAPQILHMKVISGQQLPRPRGSTAKGNSSDPYVVVEIFGVPSDCAEERTKTVKNDSFNPSFDDSFQFQISVPELALVRFLVLDDDYIGDDFIGQYTIPFDCIQSGYRHLTLTNSEGDPMENVTLFVHVAVTNRRGGGDWQPCCEQESCQCCYQVLQCQQKPKKRGMSVKRSRTKIHTGVKMVGVKHLDDLFKMAIIPLAECIQLRNQLENNVVDLQESCGLGPAGTIRQALRLIHSRMQTVPVADAQPADSSQTSQNQVNMEVALEGDHALPQVQLVGVLPDQVKRPFVCMQEVVTKCHAVVDKTESLVQKLDEATKRVSDSYDHVNSMCADAGLRVQKATRASENYAWNVRLLKAQSVQMHKTEQEARTMLKQVTDTACALGILRENCVQPCVHCATPTFSV